MTSSPDNIFRMFELWRKMISTAAAVTDFGVHGVGKIKWCGAGGWRLGFFVFPKSLSWLADGMAVLGTCAGMILLAADIVDRGIVLTGGGALLLLHVAAVVVFAHVRAVVVGPLEDDLAAGKRGTAPRLPGSICCPEVGGRRADFRSGLRGARDQQSTEHRGEKYTRRIRQTHRVFPISG